MAETKWHPIKTAKLRGEEMLLRAPAWPEPRIGPVEGDGEGGGCWVTPLGAYDLSDDEEGPTEWARVPKTLQEP